MSNFLSRLHADLRNARLTRRGATHAPKDVPIGTHKEYPRMIQIVLPEPVRPQMSLADAIEKRRSATGGNPDAPLSLTEVSTLLALSVRKRPGTHRRNYPSGGALYPIETYLISTALESQGPAVFHYNPSAHSLERLWGLPDGFDMKQVAKSPEHLPLSSLIVFTSVWQRSSAKYGDLAYLHAVLEAGHMSQNTLLTGTSLGLSVRPYAGFNDTLVAQLLDLDEELEQPVHTVTVCAGKSTGPGVESISD